MNAFARDFAGLGIAIVGCGKMGREHARAAQILGARVVTACDPLADSARALAAAHPGCTAITDVAALDWRALDAIFICTPPVARGPLELAAIAAGVPFFVEKPIGLSAAEVAPIARALERRPLIHSVGYMSRYRRSVRFARDHVAGGAALALSAAWIGKVYRRDWWLRPDQSGGPLNEQGTHLVDLSRHLLGEVVEVCALSTATTDATRGTVSASLRFASGACSTLLYSCSAADKLISVDLYTRTRAVRLRDWELRLDGEELPAGEPEEDVFATQAAAFFTAVRAQSPRTIESSFSDALRTQIVVDALGRAIATGRPQEIAP
jgi:predicted dehydrogenase